MDRDLRGKERNRVGGVGMLCVIMLAVSMLPSLVACEDKTCQGTPTPCESVTQSCILQDGCDNTTTCSGDPQPCSAQYLQSSCEGHLGCTWDGTACVGTATDCEGLGEDDCWDQLGCEPDPLACAGLADPCESYDSEFYCTRQKGCQWK